MKDSTDKTVASSQNTHDRESGDAWAEMRTAVMLLLRRSPFRDAKQEDSSSFEAGKSYRLRKYYLIYNNKEGGNIEEYPYR